jgi:hypothetical protein
VTDTKTTRARRLVEAKLAAEEADRRAKLRKREFDDQEDAWWEAMAAANESSVTLELGAPYGTVLFVRQETVRAHVRDKDRAMKAIREAGLAEALIDPLTGIRKKPLNDYMKDWLKTHAPIPDGLDFTITRYVTITIKPQEG